MNKLELAQYFDHTLLKPQSTAEEIIALCKEAMEYRFKAVCVNPYYVPLAVKTLRETSVLVATVVGFPLGATTTFSKLAETRDAIANGAKEIDMVLNIGALKAKEELFVYDDIKQVVRASSDEAIVKVIIETSLLTDEEKRLACKLAKEARADFVKTSTGFAEGGATVADIELMREVVGESMKIKASGGIRNYETALEMIEAGADRIGASASVQIMNSI